jgi:hypothetical protein
MKRKTILGALLLLIAFYSTTRSYAQEKEPTKKEIGITGRGISSLGFIYKSELKENKYLRIRTADFFLGFDNNSSNIRVNAGFALAIGVEKRKAFDNNITLLTGWEITPSYQSYFGSNSGQSIGLGLGVVIGGKYDINDKFSVSLETIPTLTNTVNINVGNNVTSWQSDLRFGLLTNTNLVLVYKFNKKPK